MARQQGRARAKARPWDPGDHYTTKRTIAEHERIFPLDTDDKPTFEWGDDGKLRRIRPAEPEPDDQDPRNFDPNADRRALVQRLFGKGADDDTDGQPDDDTPTWNPFTQRQADR